MKYSEFSEISFKIIITTKIKLFLIKMSYNSVWAPQILPLTDHSPSFKSEIHQNFHMKEPESTFDFTSKRMNKCINEQESIAQLPDIDSTNTSRHKFTPEEDIKLSKMIALHGPKKWNKIALALPGRTGRQCRDRFQNYLNPSLTNGPWTKEEDRLLEQKVYELGQHWNKIAIYFKGRSSNNVKNRWYTYFCKHKKGNHKDLSSVNSNKNQKKFVHQLNDNENCNDCFNFQNYSFHDVSMNSNNLFDPILVVNDDKTSINDFKRKTNIEEILTKSKKIKKMFFPPLYPPNDIYIEPSNQGMFDFLNQEIRG